MICDFLIIASVYFLMDVRLKKIIPYINELLTNYSGTILATQKLLMFALENSTFQLIHKKYSNICKNLEYGIFILKISLYKKK